MCLFLTPEQLQSNEARYGLAQAENEVRCGHEVQREHIELDAYPKHQGNAEDPAEDHTELLFPEKQHRRRKVRQPVYDQQGESRKVAPFILSAFSAAASNRDSLTSSES